MARPVKEGYEGYADFMTAFGMKEMVK